MARDMETRRYSIYQHFHTKLINVSCRDTCEKAQVDFESLSVPDVQCSRGSCYGPQTKVKDPQTGFQCLLSVP